MGMLQVTVDGQPTYAETAAEVPADAKWSCSFGNPGESGYVEYYRTPAGERWIVANGSWDSPWPVWTCQKVEPDMAHKPNKWVVVLPNGTPLKATESASVQSAVAKAMMMDIPAGCKVEPS